MKSSDMIRRLSEAQANCQALPESEIRFYMAHGSFRVREKIQELLTRHSPALSALSADVRLRFLLTHLQDSHDRIQPYDFPERIREFLAEMLNFGVEGETRRQLLQELLVLIEAIILRHPETARQQEATLVDPIVSVFPEVADRKSYAYGQQLASMIESSVRIVGPRRRAA